MLLVIAWRREATCMQVLILGMGRVESNMDLFFLTCPGGPRLHAWCAAKLWKIDVPYADRRAWRV